MARGISLHIGLNKVDPDQYGGWDGTLNACESDANDMKAIADSRGFESNILLTSDASAEAILAGIDRAAGGARLRRHVPGDLLGPRRTGPGPRRRGRDGRLRRDLGRLRPRDRGRRALRQVGQVQARRPHPGPLGQLPQRDGHAPHRRGRPEPGRDAGERRLTVAPLPRHAEGRHDRDVPGPRGPLRRDPGEVPAPSTRAMSGRPCC